MSERVSIFFVRGMATKLLGMDVLDGTKVEFVRLQFGCSLKQITLGNLFSFFAALPRKESKTQLKIFAGESEKLLKSWLRSLDARETSDAK